MNQFNLRLVSFELCPYVQRSTITLLEKNIEHSRDLIDLNNPPPWFTKRSPLGNVPLLIVNGEHAIFESNVICEFLDEITPGSLHSTNPIIKAKHRAWIEFGSQLLDDIGKLYNSQTVSAYQQKTEVIHNKFQRLEEVTETPFFSGDKFRLIDAVYATVFRYFEVLDPYLPVDIFSSCPKVKQWRLSVSKRNSVIHAVNADYHKKLLEFLRGRKSHISSLIDQPVTSHT